MKWDEHGEQRASALPGNIQKSLQRRVEICLRSFRSLDGTPRQIASGLAVGIFVGLSPFVMCHSLMAIFLAYLFGINRISAFTGVFITNPFTAPFLYQWTYKLGRICLGSDSAPSISLELSLDCILTLLQSAPEMIWILTVGGIAAGFPLAILSYYPCYRWIQWHQHRYEAAPPVRSAT